jgi:tight adherence protein C
MQELFSPIVIISLLAFTAVAAVIFVMAQVVTTQVRVQQRVGAPLNNAESIAFGAGIDSLITNYFDEKYFGLDGSVRAKLRGQLIRAGYFRPNAITYYIFARFAVIAIAPTTAYICAEIFFTSHHWLFKFGLVAVVMFLSVLGPDSYISRRERKMQQRYRVAFPDMLDLLVVCVDAGLSLEAALERISGEIMRQSYELGMNLRLMGTERRAGRSTIDALDGFAKRIGLDEARAFAGLLRQSIELGTDVAEALRVFSDEMRDRRLLRAEERANQLPVKMVAPLGLFIFPVILMTVMVPVGIRLASFMN